MSTAIPNLTVQQPNILQLLDQASDFQTKQSLLPDVIDARRAELQKESALAPLDVQAAQQKSALGTIDYGNTLLTQAAQEAMLADPADAPQVWDNAMRKAAQAGNPNAEQYVGHYRPDLAQRVLNMGGGGAGGQGGKGSAGGGAGGSQADPEAIERAVSQMPLPMMKAGLANMNRAIAGFNNIRDEQTWNDEIAQMRAAGIPVETMLPSTEWNPMNYAAAYKIVQNLTPYRDAIQNRLAVQATGGIPATPKPLYEPNYQYIGVNPDTKVPSFFETHSGTQTQGNAPIGPKPSAMTSNFLAKQQAWLAIHPGDQVGALEFANGKRTMDPSKMRLAATNAASRELSALSLTPEGMNIKDPQGWLKQRSDEIYADIAGAQAPSGGGAPGGGQARAGVSPSAQPPASAVQALKAHPGVPMKFPKNNQVWVWKDGKAVRVQ